MFADDRPAWQNPRILTTLLLVFLTGAVCGAITMSAGLHNVLHRDPKVTFWQNGGAQLSYERLKKELNLTPQQADSVRLVLDDFVKYHQDLQNQIEDVRATGKNRIMALLNPDQKQQFEKLCLQVQPR
jgi:hypothetical protein